ncbi:MAG: flagellar export protein FliJ [Bacillota bacterium]
MARFVFRLEPVLKCRAAREELSVQALACAQRIKKEHEETLKLAAEEYLGSFESSGETLFELQQWAVYRDLLRKRVKLTAQQLSEAVEKLERCRAALISARRDRLTVEKIKERRYATFLEEEGSKEQRDYDELSLLAFQSRGRLKS